MAVETANWLILPSDSCVEYLDDLRSGNTVGKVLGQIKDDSERRNLIRSMIDIVCQDH